jgi:hypothetical protein
MMNFAKFRTAFRTVWVPFALCASMAAAAEEHGVSFWHKDWEIVCDNTLTCRMVGYYSADGYSYEEQLLGSVLLTRAAGPGTSLQGKVTLAVDADTRPHTLTLWIDGKSLGKLTDIDADYNYSLKQAQIRALLGALKGTGKIAFTGGQKPFVLSTAGASAVMLKMDEVQGRAGTPGALVRSGNKPEESVYPARPAPVIQAAKVIDAPPRALTAPEIAALKPLLRKTLGKGKCDRMKDGEFTLTPLDAEHALISAPCKLAAYSDGDAWWVIDSALRGQPEFITSSASNYGKGVLSGSRRGRGLGDCWYGQYGQTRVWDGQTFRTSENSLKSMCRGMAGGAWHLPTFVTEVKPAEQAIIRH